MISCGLAGDYLSVDLFVVAAHIFRGLFADACSGVFSPSLSDVSPGDSSAGYWWHSGANVVPLSL